MREYIVLLRANPNYRNLWLGTVVSRLGDWFNLIASAELIANLTDSGLALSSLFLARFLPSIILSPFAGVLADRYNRRNILIITDVLRALTVLAFLLVRSPAQVWLFYLLTVLQFSLSALFEPARSAVLANVVPSDELVKANALDALTWSSMLALGAFAGGVVASIFGITAAFIADAATFILSAFFVSRIILPKRDRVGTVAAGGWLNFVDGLRYLRNHRFTFGISLVKAGGALAWGAINVLEVVFANDIFELNLGGLGDIFNIENSSSATLGAIFFMTGIGTGIGPIVMRRLLGDRPKRIMLGITIGFVMLTIGIFGLSSAPTFPLYLLGTLTRTWGSGTIWVFSAAFLQLIVPDTYRGRVFASEFAAFTLTQSMSIFAAGYMMDALGFGVRQATGVMALTAVFVLVVWIFFYATHIGRVERVAVREPQPVIPPPTT
ncbi:MAG: MFS transporter [Candidatus Promineifilaceae bacterium]|nr:MFS transporter [Candidatus Promineifilaceae bacterium]